MKSKFDSEDSTQFDLCFHSSLVLSLVTPVGEQIADQAEQVFVSSQLALAEQIPPRPKTRRRTRNRGITRCAGKNSSIPPVALVDEFGQHPYGTKIGRAS